MTIYFFHVPSECLSKSFHFHLTLWELMLLSLDVPGLAG